MGLNRPLLTPSPAPSEVDTGVAANVAGLNFLLEIQQQQKNQQDQGQQQERQQQQEQQQQGSNQQSQPEGQDDTQQQDEPSSGQQAIEDAVEEIEKDLQDIEG